METSLFLSTWPVSQPFSYKVARLHLSTTRLWTAFLVELILIQQFGICQSEKTVYKLILCYIIDELKTTMFVFVLYVREQRPPYFLPGPFES